MSYNKSSAFQSAFVMTSRTRIGVSTCVLIAGWRWSRSSPAPPSSSPRAPSSTSGSRRSRSTSTTPTSGLTDSFLYFLSWPLFIFLGQPLSYSSGFLMHLLSCSKPEHPSLHILSCCPCIQTLSLSLSISHTFCCNQEYNSRAISVG